MKIIIKLLIPILLILALSCQQKNVQLVVNSDPEKALVFINDDSIGITPLTTKIQQGAVKISVKLVGHEDFVFIDTIMNDTTLNINIQKLSTETKGEVDPENQVVEAKEGIKSITGSKTFEGHCPVLIGPRGAQLFVSYESAKKLCSNNIQYISVEKHPAKPVTALDEYRRSGDVYEKTRNGEMILVSKSSKKVYESPKGGARFIMFRGNGKNSYWLGLEDHYGRFYTLKKDSILQIVGYLEKDDEQSPMKKVRITPDGFKIIMTKGTSKNDYYVGDSYGKIYKANGENSMEQIGVYSYFWITVPDDPKHQRTILMTKSMNESDKWCGELDGVIYIQK